MKQTRVLMNMPITVCVLDVAARHQDIQDVFSYFESVDQQFSMYKKTSEILKINEGVISEESASPEMKEVLFLGKQTEQETNGYFSLRYSGALDPTGIVKGWAIHKAAQMLAQKNFKNFFVDAGGDIETSGVNAEGKPWVVGIRNPFAHEEHVKRVALHNKGIATSGTSARGQHIVNPHNTKKTIDDIASITIVADTVLNADRFATASFAMGKKGLEFIESVPGLEGYAIDTNRIATWTSGFSQYFV